jgi:hypothetical protein
MADTFKYPGEGRLASKFWRLAIAASFAAGLLVWPLFLLPETWITYIFENSPVLNGKEKYAPTTLIILLTGIFWRFNFPKVLDFHLFPYFDTSDNSGFLAITRVTGELVWSKPVGEAQTKAWNEINVWSQKEIGEGLFKWSWILNSKVELRREDKKYWFKQFDSAFLLGGNGVGKSQLAKELARKLALREDFGDSTEYLSAFQKHIKKLKFWALRICPFTKTNLACAWNVALISMQGDPSALLKDWRPSKPTFFILDDPSFDKAKKLIDFFNNESRHFWYPVRLLILDQFMPLGLEIGHDDEGHYWGNDSQERVLVSQIGNVVWDADLLRQAFSRGIWQQNKESSPKIFSINYLRSLKSNDDLQLLCDVLEGNPYLLSVALHRLVKSNINIPELIAQADAQHEQNISTEKNHPFTQIELQSGLAQRLLKDRVQELYDSHKKAKNTQHDGQTLDIPKFVTLAAIGKQYTLENKGSSNISQTTLKKLFPSQHQGTIMAPGPWLICELYVYKYFKDVLAENQESLNELILEAYSQNRDGVIRALLHHGWLATQIQTVLSQQAESDDDLAQNLLEISIYRALWLNPVDVDKAIQRIEVYLESNASSEKTEQVWQMLQDCNANQRHICAKPTPNYLARNTLALMLNARLIKQLTPDTDLAKNAKNLLEPLLTWLMATGYNLEFVPDELLTFYKAAIQNWVTQLLHTLDQIHDVAKRIRCSEFIRNALLTHLHHLQENLVIAPLEALKLDDPQAEICQQDSAYICELFLWKSNFSNLTNRELIKDKIACLANAEPSREDLQAKLTSAWCQVGYARANLPDQRASTFEVIEKIKTIANDFAGNTSIHESLAGAWSYVAFARASLPDQWASTFEVIEKIKTIANDFAGNVRIHEALAVAWLQVAFARAHLPDQQASTFEVIEKIEVIANAFAGNVTIHEALAGALLQVANVRANLPDQQPCMFEVITKIETLANAFAGNDRIHEALAGAWLHVAYERAYILPNQQASTFEVIEKLETIANDFADNVGIHDALAGAWYFVTGALPAKSKNALMQVNKLMHAFPESDLIALALTNIEKMIADASVSAVQNANYFAQDYNFSFNNISQQNITFNTSPNIITPSQQAQNNTDDKDKP